jgi:hypothetical protein
MKKKYIVMLCAVGLLGLLGWRYGPQVFGEYYRVHTLRLPGGRKMIISAESWWEYSQCMYFQVRDDTGTSGHQFFGSTGDNPRTLDFAAVVADGGNIVGVVEKYRPDVLLIVLDLESSRTRKEMARIINRGSDAGYILQEMVKGSEPRLPRVMI